MGTESNCISPVVKSEIHPLLPPTDYSIHSPKSSTPNSPLAFTGQYMVIMIISEGEEYRIAPGKMEESKAERNSQ